MRLWQVILALVMLLALLAGCAQPSPTPAPAPPKPAPAATPAPSPSPKPAVTPTATPAAAKWDEDLAIGTKTMPSTTYIMGAATSQAINKFSKKFTGRVSPAGSESVFPDAFVKGDLDLGVMESVTAYWAANGIKGWKTPMPVRMLAFGPPSHFGIVANPKSGIKTPADLKGKRWMGYRTGSDLLKDVNEAFRYAYGLSESNTTILGYSSAKEFTDALKEGRVDAITNPYYYSTPWLEELHLLGKAVLVSDTEEGLKKIAEKYPYYARQTLPANLYKGQDKEVVTFGSSSTLVVRETLPADQVYEITKLLFDNFAEWKTYYPEDIKFYELPKSLAVSRLTVPLHEGAVRYYKEKGIWTPEHEARQKALLEAIAKLKK